LAELLIEGSPGGVGVRTPGAGGARLASRARVEVAEDADMQADKESHSVRWCYCVPRGIVHRAAGEDGTSYPLGGGSGCGSFARGICSEEKRDCLSREHGRH
jgi:hypothetical protein